MVESWSEGTVGRKINLTMSNRRKLDFGQEPSVVEKREMAQRATLCEKIHKELNFPEKEQNYKDICDAEGNVIARAYFS